LSDKHTDCFYVDLAVRKCDVKKRFHSEKKYIKIRKISLTG
jgi:hypothetical protein